jgi:O6-methylguanine-DNA--protein-cysteine methyltransferase
VRLLRQTDGGHAATRAHLLPVHGPEPRTRLTPTYDHPKNVYLPEQAVPAPVDAWIGGLFDNEHRAATVEQLAAANSSTSDNARMEQARNRLADTEKRLRRLQQAIEAGANPAALVDALNRAEEERQAARDDLDRIPAGRVLSHTDIATMIDELGDVGHALDRAGPAGLEELYSVLRLEMVYDASAKTVNVTMRPIGRGSARVRGGTCTLGQTSTGTPSTSAVRPARSASRARRAGRRSPLSQ